MFRNHVFTTKQLTEMLQIHPQTFGGWLKKGILWPDVYAPSGRGTTRLFSLYNIFEASLIRELTRDKYSLGFVGEVLGSLRERQLIHTFLDRVSKSAETESQVYLLWAGDFAGQPSFMELLELGKPETDLAFPFEDFERTLVLNLSRLFKRICVELEEFGVNL